MTRRTLSALAATAMLFLGAAPAAADHDGGGYYEGGDRDRNRGGGECRDAEGNCSDDDFSPRFDESPVHICLPGSTCHFDGRGEEQQPS